MDTRAIVIPDFAVDLSPLGRVHSHQLGTWESVYRGDGYDFASLRDYAYGDDMRRIHHQATARSGKLIVRETYAERSPYIMIVFDRAPRMAAYGRYKHEIMKVASGAIINGAVAKNLSIGYLDSAKGKRHYRNASEGSGAAGKWIARIRRSTTNANFRAVEQNIVEHLETLDSLRNDLPQGSLVFVFSDFFVLPPENLMREILGRYDVQPVIVQHPVWERSFPVFRGTLSFEDAVSGEQVEAFFTKAASAQLRAKHEARYESVIRFFSDVGVEPVTLLTADWDDCRNVFSAWAESRAKRTIRG